MNRLDLQLPPSAGAPGRARQAITELLASAKRSDLIGDAALLVSELVTNAVVYTSGPISVTGRYFDRTLHVEVQDSEAELPVLQVPAALDESGRGLWLVALLAERWAIAPEAGGKKIWFELS